MTKVALIFYLLICQNVNLSMSFFSKYYQNDTDNDLINFINHFRKVYLEKRVPRHVTIFGASTEDLSKIQPLFENYPYIICTKPEACHYRSWFSPGSFVIIFLDNLKQETFEKNLGVLLFCRKSKVLYIIKGTIRNDDISILFSHTITNYGVNAQLVQLDKNVVRFYGSLITKNCSIKSRLIIDWQSGVPPNVVDTWTSGLPDLNGCPLTISTLIFAPKMLIKEHKNGSLTISGGLEGELILTLAKKFNFSIKLKYPSRENREKYSRKTSVVLEVASRRAAIGIGRLRPTSDMSDKISFSTAYDYDCVSWGVPRVMIRAESIVWMEFTWQVWAFVGLVFAIICITGSMSHNIHIQPNGKHKRMGFVMTIYEVMAIHVGIPIVNVPYSTSGKFLLIICLLYATVVTTAYKTSLASILTTDDGSPGIIDTEGIIEANLSVGGASYHLKFLEDQADENETISKLIKRFIVINKPSEVMRRLKYDVNFAGISRGSAMSYERYKATVNREPMSFNILEDCVLHHSTAIVFRKESLLRELADNVIRRLTQSGIPKYWDYPKKSIGRKLNTENYLESHNRDKFKHIFFVYFVCIAVCLMTFFIEIGTSIMKNFKKIGFTVRGQ